MHARASTNAGLDPRVAAHMLVVTSESDGRDAGDGPDWMRSSLQAARNVLRKEGLGVLREMQTGSRVAASSLRERYRFRIIGRG